MHPIFAGRGRLVLYLLSWIPLAGLLVFLLVTAGKWGWLETLVLVVPLCVIYAYVCLSAWYPVRAASFERFGFPRILITHTSGALLVSSLWVLTASGWAWLLSRIDFFTGFDQRFREQVPLLFGVGTLLYLLSVALHYALAALETSRQAEQREAAARILARDAELKVLKAQVNPHFLFNSLNSISALVSVDAVRAREMCLLLADFLRSTLGLGEKQVISLDEEFALLRSYLAVEKVRFGSRLIVEERLEEECRQFSVPPLLLQPLVENAVTHGIGNLLEGGLIRIAARCVNGALAISVENSIDPDSSSARRNGFGLANVRKRLDARYGDRARMDARPSGNRYLVEVLLPAERHDAILV